MEYSGQHLFHKPSFPILTIGTWGQKDGSLFALLWQFPWACIVNTHLKWQIISTQNVLQFWFSYIRTMSQFLKLDLIYFLNACQDLLTLILVQYLLWFQRIWGIVGSDLTQPHFFAGPIYILCLMTLKNWHPAPRSCKPEAKGVFMKKTTNLISTTPT